MSRTTTTTATHAAESELKAADEAGRAPEGGTNLLGERLGARTRLYSVDTVRGIVMVVMALDHVREFFHLSATAFDPLDLSKTNTLLFFTRWVTHYCAPTFVFLAGAGAFLSTSRGKTKPELARFLLTRGLWLILLELTLVRFGWFFNFDYHFIFMQVIWVIGCSMIVLAGLIFLPSRAVAAFGLLLIFAHNALDPVRSQNFGGAAGGLWIVLHETNVIMPRPGVLVLMAYPLIPWVGVMAVGYAFGRLLLFERERRRKILLWLGASSVALFVVLRALNVYGDPNRWEAQSSGWFTFLSFINTMKYPPSLLFLLMTLGPSIFALALFDREPGRGPGRLARPFNVFGRVPMFYYLLHVPLIHLVAVAFALAAGGPVAWLFKNWIVPANPPVRPAEWGYRL